MSNSDFSKLTMSERADLAAQVKRVRKEMGLTQAELAYEAGVTRQSIGNIESGVTTPQASTIAKVLGVLGVAPRAAEFSAETSRWLGIIGGIMDSLPDDMRAPAGQSAVSAVTNHLVALASNSDTEPETEPAVDARRQRDHELAAKKRSTNRGEIDY